MSIKRRRHRAGSTAFDIVPGWASAHSARFYDLSHSSRWREMLPAPSTSSSAREGYMTTELKNEHRKERDRLTEIELDDVVAGMQLLSNCLRMMADLQKAMVGNIR